MDEELNAGNTELPKILVPTSSSARLTLVLTESNDCESEVSMLLAVAVV